MKSGRFFHTERKKISLQDFLSMEVPYANLVLLVSLVLLLLLCLLSIIQHFRLRRLQKRLRDLFTGTDGANLETGVQRVFEQMAELKQEHQQIWLKLDNLSNKLAQSCGNVAVVRYNAFNEKGNDLSFSLAILDDEQNGVIITSIYGRDESRVYAKPIQAAQSDYPLSTEEQYVLQQASAKRGS